MALGVLIILLAVTILLILDKWPPHFVFSGAALLLVLSDAISAQELMSSFANPAIVSIFILIIITAAINDHFSLPKLFDPFLGKANSIRKFLFRLSFTVGPLSAIMNNTPIVALMTPYAYNWSKKNGFAPSRVLMPLSFITILGGMITTIGTSTNLVLNGLITSGGWQALTFYDFLVPGLIVAIPGVIYVSIGAQSILKKRKDHLVEVNANLREYLFETEVTRKSKFIGKSIVDGELRNLNGIFLVEILRNNDIISPVRPEEKIHSGDRLYFAGESDKVLELLDEDNGLQIPLSDVRDLSKGLNIVEAVVPSNSDIVGKTLKRVKFREIYDAAVIAIHRNGERLKGKIGEITIDKGDLLLISIGASFSPRIQSSKDLYLVTTIRQLKKVDDWKKKGFIASFIAIIVAGILIPDLNLFKTLLLLLSASLLFGLTSIPSAKKNTSFKLLLVLGSAIALSKSLTNSDAAEIIGDFISGYANSLSSFSVLVGLYLLTVVFSLFVTNVAAVAIMFPVAVSIIPTFEIPNTAIFLCIAFGASCSFITPFGYQTNLMVYGPGNYRFKDFARMGTPLTLMYSTLILSWLYWKYLT